jgi:adenylate kinase family enzyme
MRISIVGGPASGKSYLAEVLSKQLAIPHIQLDRFWFEAGGSNAEHLSQSERDRIRDYIKERAKPLIEKDSWVSDGFYSRSVGPEIAKRADIILFLDIPLWRRLLNHLQRIFKPSTRHGELSWDDELKFFGEIVRRAYANGPKLQKFKDAWKDKLVILHSRKEIAAYCAALHRE